jgi:hypothetical protein
MRPLAVFWSTTRRPSPHGSLRDVRSVSDRRIPRLKGFSIMSMQRSSVCNRGALHMLQHRYAYHPVRLCRRQATGPQRHIYSTTWHNTSSCSPLLRLVNSRHIWLYEYRRLVADASKWTTAQWRTCLILSAAKSFTRFA